MDLDVKIPAQLLWGAAQFCHKEAYKGALVAVQIQLDCTEHRNRVAVTIRACDGSIAYRVRLECEGTADSLPSTFMIKGETLQKILKTENYVTITRTAGELRVQGFKMGIRPDAEFNSAAFPNLDAVWPDHSGYSHNPGALVAVSGKYLATIGNVATRTTEKGVLRMHVEHPDRPIVLTTGEEEGCPEFLLMPVSVRH